MMVIQPILPTKASIRFQWSNLFGCSTGLIVSETAQQYQGLTVLITSDSLSAQRLAEDIAFFSNHQLDILHFPDWETLPYDTFSPHQDIISERLATLYQLSDNKQAVLILPIITLLQRLAPQNYVQGNSLILTAGQTLDREKLRARLETNGYRCVQQVMEHGEFAVRGSIFDIFPMGSKIPYRIDLIDDSIDTLRSFDPETQRTKNKTTQIYLLPAYEFPLTKESIALFREQWCATFKPDPKISPVFREVTKGNASAGIEYYLPLFFEKTEVLFDYLPEKTLIIFNEDLKQNIETFWQDLNYRYEQLRHDIERPILEPSRLYLRVEELFHELKQYPQISIGEKNDKSINFPLQIPPNLPIDNRAPDPLSEFKNFVNAFDGQVLIVAETAGRRENLLELLKKHYFNPQLIDNWQDFLNKKTKFALTVAPLTEGLILNTPNLAIISETQLFGERVAQRRRRKSSESRDPDAVIRNLTELHVGAPVVHEEHGVGRYLGLEVLKINEIQTEFLQLEYAGGDKLYVPVTSLHLISRFTGVDPEHAPLHRLGSGQWQKAKRKAAEKVRDVAAELLGIYAQRATRQGHVFKQNIEEYQAFAAGFPFEETPDQQNAIDAVLADMTSSKPMDRLICGDVGFGKTEVAMRAAFVAVQDGKQVAVLVPTTLLAQQHYQNFCDRFADWAVKVEQLSRFRSAKQQVSALADMADGKIDIVIGTHKLLQDNIKFKRLGLVIIDEEHRFGVRQKERFKSLRSEVDILTMTATPIPRSLNLALSDLRDLSIIATPPAKRLAVKTFVQEWRKPVITEAIHRELRRGGQVYFLHNDIDTIKKIANELEELVPEARIRTAHGQMPERELEQVMQDFYHRRFNVLVCTTIIETGIDVPTANTIIINRADKFGLAQLYQLRGRVGRSHHRAYAYLITPPKKSITEDAIKRLDALSALEELGVGFTLATHDLEIRGAGELLGDEQSGHVQEIGFSLYTELLERAVQALKDGKHFDLDKPSENNLEIELRVAALLPEDFVPDVHSRLICYKRIAGAKTHEELDELQIELIDRFGLFPEPAKNLFAITALKITAKPFGIKKIELHDTGGKIQFFPDANIDPTKLIQLIREQPRLYKLELKEHLLRINTVFPDFKTKQKFLDNFFNFLK
jgi:transcription-repair coupling factor (superfamily II helicase)